MEIADLELNEKEGKSMDLPSIVRRCYIGGQ